MKNQQIPNYIKQQSTFNFNFNDVKVQQKYNRYVCTFQVKILKFQISDTIRLRHKLKVKKRQINNRIESLLPKYILQEFLTRNQCLANKIYCNTSKVLKQIFNSLKL